MTTPPAEQRIRNHLDTRGRPSTVQVSRLLGTWRITDPTPEDRRRVTELLASVGVVVDPDLEGAPLDAHVVVSVADEATLARRARMREAAGADAARAAEEERRRAEEEVAEEARRAEEERRVEEERRRAEREAQERAVREAEEAREAEARRRAREADAREAERRREAEAAAAAPVEERVWMEDAFEEAPARPSRRARREDRRAGRDEDRAARRRARGAGLAVADEDTGPAASEEPVELPESFPRTLVGAGALVLAVALVLPWYSARRGGITVEELSNAWDFLGLLDVLIVAVILGAAAIFCFRPRVPGPARLVGIGAVAVLVGTAYRIGAPPDDVLPGLILEVDLRPGPFVALLGAAILVCGTGLMARIEGLPGAPGPRPRRGPGADGGPAE